MKNTKRILAALFAAAMVVSGLPAYSTGEAQAAWKVESAAKGSKTYKSGYEKYNTYFYYNQLSAKEKKFYDALNDECLKVMKGKTDITNSVAEGGRDYYYIDPVNYKECGLKKKEAKRVYSLFRYSNPQYFFLSGNSATSDDQIAMVVYSDFRTADAISTARDQILDTIDGFDDEISAAGSTEEKVRVIHDAILNRVSYNQQIFDTNFENDEKEYSQSVYSTFVWEGKKTVCAGYSFAFAMMCNKYNIDAVCITSKLHQWNAVRINDQWYIVDPTFDDEAGAGYPIVYTYFLQSEELVDSIDEQMGNEGENHKEESIYKGIMPDCLIDTNSGYIVGDDGNVDLTYVGECFKPTDKAKAPKITVNGNKATIKAEKYADIYYTTDGSTPSPASTKCTKYTGKFKVKKGQTIRAVAVLVGCKDSKVVKKKVK